MATTHYAELKAYALDTPGVTNGCCEFDIETLRPTYKLLIGVPGRSNAFAILAHLGMEQSVIDNAKAIVGSDNRDFEAVLEKLEASRHALEEPVKLIKQSEKHKSLLTLQSVNQVNFCLNLKN